MQRPQVTHVSSLLIVHGREALTAERKAAELLAQKLGQRAGVHTRVLDDAKYKADDWQALLFVGHPDRNLVSAALMASHGIRRPNELRPGPEGYIVQSVGPIRPPTVIITGTDVRGSLYGVGAFLRAIDLSRPGQVGIPHLNLTDAPAFPVRGSDLKFWQENRAAELGMGLGSLEQWEEQIADLALWGINLIWRPLFNTSFETWLDEQEHMMRHGPGAIGWRQEKEINHIIHEYGLQIGVRYPPNTIAPSLARTEWNTSANKYKSPKLTRLACPSFPQVRDRILYERVQIFKELEHIDHFFVPPYNIGGCHCEKCRPWVKTYVKLAEATAELLRRYHPKAKVWLSNQGLSPDENEWLWLHLTQERPSWFHVMQFGPAADELSPHVRPQRVHKNWKRYPVMNTLASYLHEMARRVPVDYALVFQPDITHAAQAQYGMERIDPALLRMHTRESPFIRPAGYYDIFESIAKAGAGISTYSEGLYDDANKILWAQWAWTPDRSPWNATLNYAQWWFGSGAAKTIAQAFMQSEGNWSSPLADNDHIEQIVITLDRAEMNVPPHLQRNNWRWTMWRLRSLLDLLAQRKLQIAAESRRSIIDMLTRALTRLGDFERAITNACQQQDVAFRENKLCQLKLEIRELGERLFNQIGLRLPAITRLDAELTNLSWDLAHLGTALQSTAPEIHKRKIETFLSYADPGLCGFYDDCGHVGRDPHLVVGHRVPRAPGLNPENRPSANTLVCSFGETEDIIFVYHDLEPKADYTVRLTYVSPDADLSHFYAVQRLYAGGFIVHNDLELPRYNAQQFDYALPPQAFADGSLELRFVRAEPGLNAAVSEIWLINNEN